MFAKRAKLFFGLSIVFLLIAVLLAAWGLPKIVSRQIQKNIEISNTSKMYDKWLKLPMPLLFKVYVFNVTNPEEINQGKKPVLNEIGPFVYKEYRERTILGYGDNDTIRYTLTKQFVFDAEASGGLSENDEITVINFSYLGAILTVHSMMPALVGMVNGALEQFFTNLTDPFTTVAAKDLFFDGIFLNCIGDNSALGLVCGNIRTQTPQTMRPAEDGSGFYFSMFHHMNNTPSEPYEMVRGTEDVSQIGNIVSYKDKSSMAVWGDEYCGMINGSDSSIFPPIDENNVPKRVYTFEPDICRSLYASLVGKSSKFNITAYYYEIEESAFAAKSANRDNRCFCKRNWSANHDGCLLMGLLNLAPCQGAPAIASLPHFYLGSEELLEYFDGGISPDKEKHNNYVYIDPITGVVLEGVKRLQFNIELRQMPLIPQLAKVPTGLFPMLWIEEGAAIPVSIQEELKQSHKLISYVEISRWLVLAAAVLATIATGAMFAKAAALCPRNNSVTFIHRDNHVNKGQ